MLALLIAQKALITAWGMSRGVAIVPTNEEDDIHYERSNNVN